MSNKIETKFPALAVGQRFHWRGRRFVKTGPLLARAEDGGRSQMIPRSATVELAEAAADPAPATDSVRQALDDLRQTALDQLDAVAADATAQKAAAARKEIEAACARVLRLLDSSLR